MYNDYSPERLGVRPAARLSATFLTQAFTWMFLGLLLSAFVAFLVQTSTAMQDTASGLFLPAIIGEFVLVFAIGLGIRRMNATLALGLFFVYAALNGLTIGLVVTAVVDANGSYAPVASAFVSSAAMFGGAAVYGAVTKRSLSSVGGFLWMGLIGLIVAMLVNTFLASGTLGLVISVAGVVIFTVLTAWDVQRISNGQIAAFTGTMEKASVFGALQLYLDFINLFLFLLRIFGGNRR